MDKHFCHADGCEKKIPPEFLMCRRHWYMVPMDLRGRVWTHYRPGQEIDKRPTLEYIEVAQQAIDAVARREGRSPGRRRSRA